MVVTSGRHGYKIVNSTAIDDDVPPVLDASAIHSPSRNDRTFDIWVPTLPVVPHIDDDISMEFVNDVDMRPNLTDTQVAEDSVNPPPTAQIEDVTFNVPDREFVRPDPVIERSLLDPPLDDDIPEDTAETFEEVVNGTKRGGRKLISSKGYTYTIRRKTEDRVFWSCSVRGKKAHCYATVKQYRDMYSPGPNTHNHPADPGASLKVKVSAKVKQVARENVFLPAAAIVEDALNDMMTPDSHCLPSTSLLTRAANLHMENLRPKEPTDLSFEINEGFIGENFLIDDIRVDEARHILMATADQLLLMRDAKRWFIDGTFKIVRRPFYQLMTIHAFVKNGEDTKQVPLVYCLMSRRSKQDYVEVFRSLKDKIPGHLVEWIMMDFEAATWQALRLTFPGTLLKGCVFHWSQRIYRKIASVGLSTAYMEKGDKYRYIRKLMALPFLPAEHITTAFSQLEQQATDVGGPLQEVTAYMRRIWIAGTVWRVENWSVFRETVRTNNDVEGWHRRINTRAGKADLGMYVLIPLLKKEAINVDTQIRLVSEHLLTRINRKKYANIHGRLFKAWDRYEDDEMTTTQLLREVSNIAGLGPATMNDAIHDEEEEQQ